MQKILLRDSKNPTKEQSWIKVVPGVTSALFSSVSASGSEVMIAGEQLAVEFAARDSSGQLKAIGGDLFDVAINPVTAVADPKEFSAQITDLQTGRYRLTVQANKSGTYNAHILLKGKEILGSPVLISVSPAAPRDVFLADPTAAPPSSIIAGQVASFGISCHDEFGNRRTATASAIGLSVDNPSRELTEGDISANIARVRLAGADSSMAYLVSFACTKAMSATVSVRSSAHPDGNAVVWKVQVVPDEIQFCDFIQFAASSAVDLSGVVPVVLSLADKFRNAIAATAENIATLEYQLKMIVNKTERSIQVDSKHVRLQNENLTLFLPSLPLGTFHISVHRKDQLLASRRFSVVPGPVAPSSCSVVGRLPRSGVAPTAAKGFGLGAFGGLADPNTSPEYLFSVDLVDCRGNPIEVSGTNFSVQINALSQNISGPTIKIHENSASLRSVSVRFSVSGKYAMHISVNNTPIKGSPFSIVVVPPLNDFLARRRWIAQDVTSRRAGGNPLQAMANIGAAFGVGGLGLGYRPASGTILLSRNQRDIVLNESLETILRMDSATLNGLWRVSYRDSASTVDGGGVLRSWATNLSKYFLDPNFALFQSSKEHQNLYLPSRNSSIHARHISWFKAIGRFVGKMAARNANETDPIFLPGGFTDGFLAQILGIEGPLGASFLEEMKQFDADYHRHLSSLLSMTDVEDMGLVFEQAVENFGTNESVELKPGGKEIAVDDSNKAEYVELSCQYRLRLAALPQVQSFREGFVEAFPEDSLAVLNPAELGLLIFGKDAPLDIGGLKSVVRLAIAFPSLPSVVVWFWEIMQFELDQDQQRAMLKFWTGLEREPITGWRELNPPPVIQLKPGAGVPSAGTCSKAIKLPSEMKDKETLKRMMLEHCIPGNDDFGLT